MPSVPLFEKMVSRFLNQGGSWDEFRSCIDRVLREIRPERRGSRRLRECVVAVDGVRFGAYTGLSKFDEVIAFDVLREFPRYTVELVFMDVNRFIEEQIERTGKALEAFGERGVGAREAFFRGINETTLHRIRAGMEQGDVFPSFLLEFEANGEPTRFQEGRHRAIAAQMLGVEKVPVWRFVKRGEV